MLYDELLEKAKETGLPPLGPNDILCQALGKPDHPGRVVGQDRLVRPSSYFHQPSDDMKKNNQRRNMGNGVKGDAKCCNKTNYVSSHTPF